MRLQVMFLPAPADEYPFVLIFDEAKEGVFDRDKASELSRLTGAKAVLVFAETVELV